MEFQPPLPISSPTGETTATTAAFWRGFSDAISLVASTGVWFGIVDGHFIVPSDVLPGISRVCCVLFYGDPATYGYGPIHLPLGGDREKPYVASEVCPHGFGDKV